MSTVGSNVAVAREVWRHADERPSRDEPVRHLAEMLGRLLRRSGQEQRDLAPYLGIACPGRIAPEGRIKQGAQNLPGDRHAADFNLPSILHHVLSADFGWDAVVLMHNDAVVQGPGEVPFMADVEHWGMLTIGTGLSNAHFTNR
jgi:hypothetical protein